MLNTELRRLRKANRRLHESITLKDDDAKLMNQMFTYLSHKRLNPYDAEAVRADLLGMAQEAKQRKQPLRELIGDDYAFCDSLLANCNKSRPLAVLCDCLALLFRMAFIYYSLEFFYFTNGFKLFSGQPYTLVITTRHLFVFVALYVIFELLMGKIIPQSYAAHKHINAIMLLAFVIAVVIQPLYIRIFPPTVLFSVNGYANLAVLALLALIWLGLRYTADTLDYRQSSLGRKAGGE